MDISSLVVGCLLLVAASVLQWRTSVTASQHESETELDNLYFTRRTRGRQLVHLLMALCAALAIGAGIVGRGRAFVLIWASVPLVLFIIVILAMIDALRTHRYHTQKLPEIRRASFPEAESDINPQ